MNRLLTLLYPGVLIIVFALLFLTSLDKAVVIDYDEGVYAEVSRAMFVNNEPLIPELNGEGFFEKPPMLYWAQMLGYKMFGINSLGARIVNAAAAILTLLIFYFGAAAPLGKRTAFNATLILGSSIIFVYLARVAMTDMLLTLFLVACLIVSWNGVERFMIDKKGASLFWLGCLSAALAMLSKGAIGALFPVLTAVIYLLSIGKPLLIFNRRWFIPGSLILILIGFSWYLLLGFVHPEGFSFMKELFVRHHLSRFSSAMEGHSGSVFYYLIILSVGFMPWFGYLVLAFIKMDLRTRNDPGLRYLHLFAIFSVIVFIFFSAAATKLPNYILSALPGFALLIAKFFENDRVVQPDQAAAGMGLRIAGWIGVLPVALLALVCLALPFVYPYLAELIGEDAYKVPALFESVDMGLAPYFAALLFFISTFLIFRAVKGNPAKLFETLVLSSFINGCTLFFLIIPLYDRLLDTPLTDLAKEASIHTPENGRIIMYEIDDRPSVNFVSGRLTVEHNERDHLQLPELFANPDIEVGLTSAFYFERLQNLDLNPMEIARDTGFVLFRLDSEATENISP